MTDDGRRPRARRGAGSTQGLLAGAAVGLVLGLMLGQIGRGIVFGAALGLLVGTFAGTARLVPSGRSRRVLGGALAILVVGFLVVSLVVVLWR